MATPRFKPCAQHQPMLLPPSVEELIPDNALVCVVDSIVDGMDRSLLESTYPGGGTPAHDPSMMLKVVLFCYASGIYSSRKIAAATRENVNLMWLTGMSPLDHSTVNRFRSERVRPVFEDVFSEVVATKAEAVYMATQAPAEANDIADECGSIRPGRDADFVVLTGDLSLVETYLGGESVYTA
ncbi:transposase [Collinsella tanakaei]|nr:transposase [Collinsella tanakaei]